jgi:enterochelin esterase-like enzyme
MGVKRGARRLVLLLAFLNIILPSCALSQLGPDQPEAAVLPPVQALPTELSPATLPASLTLAPPATPESELPVNPMPTAIARAIGEAFPTLEATATPIPTPTATPCDASGQIITGTYQSKSAGLSLYRIYLPPCYEDGERVYPALYMLPGNIHTDSVWDDLGLDDAAEAAIKRGEIPPLLIVMAAGGQLANYTSGGPWSYESVIMDDLIPYIESTYCAWQEPAGRAIGGMSRGGYWALEIAFRHPDHFASVGGHSAALLDLYGGADVVPQSTGLANDLGDLRIYFDIGENDWVIPNVGKLHEDMESAGKAHEWVVNEGRHEDAYWASHTKEYITWYSEPWPMQRDTYPLCMLESTSQSQ